MAKKQQLTTLDWINAAFRALTIGGPQAIKVEAIARDLKVSKGSFYWHFKDLADLKRRMLSHWQDVATAAIILEVDNNDMSAQGQLEMVVALASDATVAAHDSGTAEGAIRDWARYDANAKQTLANVDTQRLAYLAGLFARDGADQGLSKSKAAVLYAGLIGLESLEYTGAVQLKNDLELLLGLLI